MKKLFTSLIVVFFTYFCGSSQNIVNWDWTNVFTGTGNTFAKNIAVDSLDNVYVIGTFSDTLFIGSDTLVSYGSDDLYIAKFNSGGALLWHKQLGSVGGDVAGPITTDRQGDMYLFAMGSTGNYFIGDQDTITNCVSYILKLSPSGTVLAKTIINGNIRRLINIQADDFNNIYGAVDIYDNLTIGDSILQLTGSMMTYYSAFFKLNETGTCTWIKESFPFMSTGAMSNFKTDGDGNIYTALTLSGYNNLGDGVEITVPSTTMYAFVLAKYNTNKQCLWARQVVNNPGGISESYNISLDKYNGLYLSGMSMGTSYIGDSIFVDDSFAQKENGFFVRYDTSGSFKWARLIHSNMNGADICLNYAFGKNNWGYMLGVFNDTLYIGNDTLYGSHTDISTSTYLANSAFVSKIDTSGNVIKSYYAGEIGPANICTNSLGDLFVAGYNTPTGAKTTQDTYRSFSAGLLAPRLPFIQLTGNDTICLGSPTGNLSLPSSGLTVLKWQKSFNNQAWVDISSTSNIYTETPLVSGLWSYRAEAQLIGDFPSFTIPVNIEVVTKPEASFTHSLTGLSVSCTSTSVRSDSLVWMWGDGSRTETTQNTVNHTYVENNQYSITLISYNECGSDSITETISMSQGIGNNSNNFGITCYPNPTSGLIKVTINKGGLDSSLKLSVFSILGQKIYESNLPAESFMIDLKSQPKGIYYLVVQGHQFKHTEKIIKQ